MTPITRRWWVMGVIGIAELMVTLGEGGDAAGGEQTVEVVGACPRLVRNAPGNRPAPARCATGSAPGRLESPENFICKIRCTDLPQ
jgi:hypothetical protein